MEGVKESYLSGYPNIISYECSKIIISQMKRNICKINIGAKRGTGFFCKIPFPNNENMLSVFITNNHVINEDFLKNKNGTITIIKKEDEDEKIINIKNRITYTSKEYDITIIEIKEYDNINNFMELDDGIIKDIKSNKNENINYKDQTIYIIQYPEGELSVSYGILHAIYEEQKFKFMHKCSTRKGSSGSPILNLNNKIIGIHNEGYYNTNYNQGIFLNYPIKEFISIFHNKALKNKNIIGEELNIKPNQYKEKSMNLINIEREEKLKEFEKMNGVKLNINNLINITVNNKTYSIYYSIRNNFTFQDLLEYFAFLYPELNICQCYHFRMGGRGAQIQKISKLSNITAYLNYLKNLHLYNDTNGDKCTHSEENILLYNKLYIYSEYTKKINNLKQQILSKNNLICENAKIIEEKTKKNMSLIQSINGNEENLEVFNNGIVLQLKQNINDEKTKFRDFYDVIIHIDSIKDINKGWKVEMSEKGEKAYNEFKNKELLKIGIIGNANKGKSFLLSKISRIELPSGMSIKTEGLSIKYPDPSVNRNKTIALIDSAGLETPVLLSYLESEKYKNEFQRELFREKLTTELFLKNYIVNNSDILIVVVDSLSFSEQTLLILKTKKI